MILGIDAHKLDTVNPTGTDKVTSYFVQNIDHQLAGEFDKIVLYTKKPISKSLREQLPPNAINKVLGWPIFWSSLGLSWEMYLHTPDVLFVPSHSLPFVLAHKNVVIIHDIGFLKYPQNYSPKQYLHLVNTTKLDLKKADYIITISQFVKKTLIDTYYADPNKIKVVPLGVDREKFVDNFSQKIVDEVLEKYPPTIAKHPYFFFIGRLDHRKNIVNIIKAFSDFKFKNKTDHVLLLAGKAGHGYQEILKESEKSSFSSDIVFCDYVSDEDLPVILSQAEIFLFPTLYEGFGLPILEAQACGVPVICSNTTSMPEITGDSALLVNPENFQEIGLAIKKLIDNPTLAVRLREKGLENIKSYNWQTFSRETLKILIELSKKI